VLVGVMKGGVEPGGQPGFGVVGQQPEHHLQATSLQPGPPVRRWVHLVGSSLAGTAARLRVASSTRADAVAIFFWAAGTALLISLTGAGPVSSCAR